MEALLEENRQRGVETDPWSVGARWGREEDIPDEECTSAREALLQAGEA